MPIQSDTPISQGAYDEWGLFGSAPSKPASIQSDDGDTSVIYAASGGREVWDTYSFPLLTGVTDPVAAASITAITREYRHGAGHAYFMLWNNAAVGSDQASTVHNAGGYTAVTFSASGGQLALSSVNGQHGAKFQGAGGVSNKAEF